jgi:pyruvate/2-oxoglutarate dehydrogenase complex dihydrolipoamide acyltransferase (E2) component
VSVDAGAGLIVPVIEDVGGLNLAGIAAAIGDFLNLRGPSGCAATSCRAPHSPLRTSGGFGTFAGTPIINPPQVAILGMYSMARRTVVVADSDSADEL